ncbi:hypothetical protein F8388_000698 [Cannabis sativa]|uniref:Uncharacterized protein n=1 Tax=Cannabis sativa TaxID=3483 RepID=A0A7J6ED61_CANSA|nr:hypothetical protein F8388_000698 [Cannabis sativa]
MSPSKCLTLRSNSIARSRLLEPRLCRHQDPEPISTIKFLMKMGTMVKGGSNPLEKRICSTLQPPLPLSGPSTTYSNRTGMASPVLREMLKQARKHGHQRSISMLGVPSEAV